MKMMKKKKKEEEEEEEEFHLPETMKKSSIQKIAKV